MPLCGDDHAKLIARINRTQGQVNGLKKMVEESRDFIQILKQIAAVVEALRSLGAMLLKDHLKGCVAAVIREQNQASDLIAQVVNVFKKFNK